MFCGEEFHVFCAWQCNRKTFTPVTFWKMALIQIVLKSYLSTHFKHVDWNGEKGIQLPAENGAFSQVKEANVAVFNAIKG